MAAQWGATGTFDQLELTTGIAGLVASAIAYLARNKINPRQLEIQVFLEVLRQLHDEINARDRVVPKAFDDQWRPKRG